MTLLLNLKDFLAGPLPVRFLGFVLEFFFIKLFWYSQEYQNSHTATNTLRELFMFEYVYAKIEG